MPTLNQDGTINYNTDAAFDMDNNEEYYNFVCGLIASSMQVIGRPAGNIPSYGNSTGDTTGDDDNDKVVIDPTAVEMNVATMQRGLVCCMNIEEHFKGYSLSLTEEKANELAAMYSYQKKNGDPRWEIPLNYTIQYFIVNTASVAIPFDRLCIYFNSAGTSGWQFRVKQDCQPYGAVIKGGSMKIESPFETSEENIALMEKYFGIRQVPTKPGEADLAGIVIPFNATKMISISPSSSVLLLTLNIIVGGRTVYINGETPVELKPNFCGLEYDIFGAHGQDGKGGFYATPSYALNTQTGVLTGIQKHCSKVIQVGARWYESWSEEYPGTFYTYEKIGETVEETKNTTQEKETSAATRVLISTYIKNDTDSVANLRISMYGQDYTYSVPAGFIGRTEIEIEIPPVTSLTDNTSLEISSQFNISIDKGEVSNTTVQVIQDPTIPTIPTIRSSKHQQLGLVDKLVMTLTGAKNPDVTEGLTLVDFAYVTLRRKIDKPAEDSLLLLDSAYATLRRKIDKPAEEGLLLLDSASITHKTGAIDNKVLDALTLVDQAYVTRREQLSDNTTANNILVLSDKALVSK